MQYRDAFPILKIVFEVKEAITFDVKNGKVTFTSSVMAINI